MVPDLSGLRVLFRRCGIDVLPVDHGLAVGVHGHRNPACDALTFAHHRRAAVGDVEVVRQHQGTYHALLVLVKVDFLEGRAAIAHIEQHLVKVGGVFLHHRGDLVVHKVRHPFGLHGAFACLFPQYLSTHGPARGEQLFQGLCLKLHNALRQEWVLDATRTTERTGAFFIGKAQ